MPSIHPPAYPYSLHAKHAIYATHIHYTACLCLCQMHHCDVCVVKQIIQESNRSQTQQLFSTPCLGAWQGEALRPVTPAALSHSGQREHYRVSLSGHELFHVHASLSTCSRLCRDRVKGLWLTKPLIPQQPRTLWSASLRRREDQSSPDTFLPVSFLFYSFHLYGSLHLSLAWTLISSRLHFPLFFSLPPHNISIALDWQLIKQQSL